MSQYTIGIDLGGTTMTAGLVDETYHIVAKLTWATRLPRPADDLERALADLCRAVAKEGKIDFSQVAYVGIGTPGSVNFTTGFVGYNTNFGYYDWNLGPDMEQLLGCRVYVENDANAAAMGEMTYGAAKGMKDFIMITLGTGIGSGIVINGQMVYGHDGFAGELGHTCAVRGGRACNCGRNGCLETYCSAIGVARTAREWLETYPDARTELRGKIDISSKDVYEAAANGDEFAKRIFDFTGRILGESIADFVAFSAPEAIVLFGGLARSGDLLRIPLEEAMNKNMLSIWKDKVKIVFSQLKESDAAILGASALAW